MGYNDDLEEKAGGIYKPKDQDVPNLVEFFEKWGTPEPDTKITGTPISMAGKMIRSPPDFEEFADNFTRQPKQNDELKVPDKRYWFTRLVSNALGTESEKQVASSKNVNA